MDTCRLLCLDLTRFPETHGRGPCWGLKGHPLEKAWSTSVILGREGIAPAKPLFVV